MTNQFVLTYPELHSAQQTFAEETFPVVDETGQVTSSASRAACHTGTMLLHPVVHLHIFDQAGRLYLQKRSLRKDIQPGKWDTAVGGHVDYGETIMMALQREAREELGLSSLPEVRPLFHYIWQSAIEREVVCAFAITYEGVIVPDRDEVDDGRFWSYVELLQSLGCGVFTPQFEQELKRLEALGIWR